jgi:chromosome segregation ATPase
MQKIQILDDLKRRNRQEVAPFHDIISHYNTVMGECIEYKNMINGLRNEVRLWKSRCDEFTDRMRIKQDSFATTQHVRDLEEKIFSLQSDLVTSFHEKSDTAQKLLEFNRDMLKLRRILRDKKAELATMKIELQLKDSLIESLKATIADKEESIHTISRETEAMRQELVIRDKIISELQQKLRNMPNEPIKEVVYSNFIR